MRERVGDLERRSDVRSFGVDCVVFRMRDDGKTDAVKPPIFSATRSQAAPPRMATHRLAEKPIHLGTRLVWLHMQRLEGSWLRLFTQHQGAWKDGGRFV